MKHVARRIILFVKWFYFSPVICYDQSNLFEKKVISKQNHQHFVVFSFPFKKHVSSHAFLPVIFISNIHVKWLYEFLTEPILSLFSKRISCYIIFLKELVRLFSALNWISGIFVLWNHIIKWFTRFGHTRIYFNNKTL